MIYFLIWYAVGIASFLYWWTKDFDFTTVEVRMAAILGLFGPITLIACWFAHEPDREIKILIRKRGP